MFKHSLKVLIALLVLAITVISPMATPNSAEASTAESEGIVTSGFANVYRGPGKAYGLTGGTVSKGELVTAYQVSNGWTYIKSNNDYGWVWGDFIKRSSGTGVLTASYANLYKDSYSSSGTKGQITQGTAVSMFETKNGWRHIFVNGEEAWVWGEFVSPANGLGTISASYVNLYKGPGKAYGTDGTATNGTTVTFAGVKNGWRQVFIEGRESWIWDSYITKGTFGNVTEGVITNASFVNIYKSSGKSNGIKGQFNNGQAVMVFQNTNGWSYVQSGNMAGWVWGTYVTAESSTGVIKNTSYANVYKDALSSSGTKGRLDGGTAVAVYENSNGWQHIKSGDLEGWVWGDFVESKMKIASGSDGIVAASASANVYRGPGKSYSTIGSIAKGAEVHTFNLHNGWRFIQSGSIEGWVWGEYVDRLSNITVFLDPGHGDNDPGGMGYGMKEKDLVLDIGLKARNLFGNSPLNVMMTRTADKSEVTSNGTTITTSDSLRLRTGFAKKHTKSGNDIFISLHTNAFNGSAEGGESYYYQSAVNPYSADSKLLAESIQKRLIEYMQLKDRGVDHGNFAVLRENIMPASLIEMGFIDNEGDAKKLKEDYWRLQAAKAVYQGTLDYYERKGFNVNPYKLK
ncbi:N-acetylmuramoyl-L-alanine amidase [Cytobacillus firmus]|uniref:N-acetylmuramoyl-L-alanine amidase n=1 Tax=Cytobacillus firmus TaxID=1399 RepID=UPI0021878638|nr:N-acetylmuramoyl-L-alanine amidase [Cytobacillus firmus]URM33415.1 N-acetylmuramoyl-L-alanine amidase [Cytobacillus firmus]